MLNDSEIYRSIDEGVWSVRPSYFRRAKRPPISVMVNDSNVFLKATTVGTDFTQKRFLHRINFWLINNIELKCELFFNKRIFFDLGLILTESDFYWLICS